MSVGHAGLRFYRYWSGSGRDLVNLVHTLLFISDRSLQWSAVVFLFFVTFSVAVSCSIALGSGK